MHNVHRNRRLVIHPVLFAIFSVLSVLSANISEVEVAEALRPAAFSLLAALLLLAVLVLAFKDVHKGALAASLFLALIYSYGHALNVLDSGQSASADVIAPAILATWTLISSFGIVGIMRTKRDLLPVSQALNAAAIFMLVIPMITIVGYELTKGGVDNTLGRSDEIYLYETGDSRRVRTPDIYYLIFDRYSSTRELKRVVDFDNSRFTNYLENQGFYVAERSRANYVRTFRSLSSSLNMEYHESVRDTKSSIPLIQDSRVARFLKNRGYTFVNYESTYPATGRNPFADINVANDKRKLGSFSRLWLDTTLAQPILAQYYPLKEQRQTLFQLDSLTHAQEIAGPKFVFAHLLLPHEPYLFDRDGRPVAAEDQRDASEIELYKDYVLFANKRIKEIVDALMAEPDDLPIIIIQADEGFSPRGKDLQRWRNENEFARELRFSILNAYFLPGIDADEVLYDTITPVNSFRIILNAYFQKDLELLEDESFVVPPIKGLASFKRITDSLRD